MKKLTKRAAVSLILVLSMVLSFCTPLADVLGLPENVTVAALLPMGYPSENAEALPLHSQYRDAADTIAEL